MSDWTDDKPILDMSEMDNLITSMRNARIDYDDAKAISNEKHKAYKDLELEVIKALSDAGKSSYKLDGVGTFSVIDKLTVTTPKTVEEKAELFNWIDSQHGRDTLTTMLSINHQTLNSFYKESFESSDDKAMFSIPGLNEPTVTKEGRFRSSK